MKLLPRPEHRFYPDPTTGLLRPGRWPSQGSHSGRSREVAALLIELPKMRGASVGAGNTAIRVTLTFTGAGVPRFDRDGSAKCGAGAFFHEVAGPCRPSRVEHHSRGARGIAGCTSPPAALRAWKLYRILIRSWISPLDIWGRRTPTSIWWPASRSTLIRAVRFPGSHQHCQ